MPRLKAGVWVAAFVRRVAAQGAYAAVSRRGDESAGAIFVEVLHDGGADLYGPRMREDGGRSFEVLATAVSGLEIAERIEREARFDSDLWVVTVEDRAGRTFFTDDERG